jgi:hypothetical protein
MTSNTLRSAAPSARAASFSVSTRRRSARSVVRAERQLLAGGLRAQGQLLDGAAEDCACLGCGSVVAGCGQRQPALAPDFLAAGLDLVELRQHVQPGPQCGEFPCRHRAAATLGGGGTLARAQPGFQRAPLRGQRLARAAHRSRHLG